MLYPSIDELKKRADSRYTLVMIASKRSRDLIDGYPPLVSIGNEKPVSIATEEIARDMISYTRTQKSLEDEEMAEAPEESEDTIFTEAVAGEEGLEASPEEFPETENNDDSAAAEEKTGQELVGETKEDGESATVEATKEMNEITEDEK